jgi:hypothetical protein
MFEKEEAFYKAHIDEFRQKYLDKELVIVGDRLVAVYDDFGRAYREPAKTYKPGTYMVAHVYPEGGEPPLQCVSAFYVR